MTGWHLIADDLGLREITEPEPEFTSSKEWRAWKDAQKQPTWIDLLELEREAQEYLAPHDRFARFLRERGDEAPI